MKLFHLSLTTLMLRFYLMMAVVIVAGFAGIWPIAFLALPIFMTCLLGVKFTFGDNEETYSHTQRIEGRRVSHRHAQTQHAA